MLAAIFAQMVLSRTSFEDRQDRPFDHSIWGVDARVFNSECAFRDMLTVDNILLWE